jgi:uncharacterized protein (DUF983 family)
MATKNNVIYNIVAMKCPRCHQGDLYRTPLSSGKIYDMHTNCPVCNLKYDLEPGFFWGAMYVGYALSSGALLITGLLCLTVFNLSLPLTYGIIIVTAIIGFAYNARVARAIWLNMYVDYDPEARSEKVSEKV